MLLDSIDGTTAKTGITFSSGDIKVSKNGGAEANHAGTVTELAGGVYYYEATSTELDTLGYISIRFTKATVRTFISVSQVVSAVTAAPTAAAIRTEMDSNSTKLANLDTNIASRLASSSYTAAPTAVAVRQEMDSNSTKLANMDATISSRLAASGYTAPPTTVAIRTEMDSNSTKLAKLDETISSRLAASSYTAAPTAVQVRQEIDSNSTKLDVTTGSRLAASSYSAAPSATSIADAILTRDWTAVTGEASRSVLNALRALRNKVSRTSATEITVTEEDDTTAAWTATITTDNSASPITGVDPS